MTDFYQDCLDEAQELKATIEARQAAETPQGRGETQRLLTRFRALQAILRGEEHTPDQDPLSRDIEAQKRGEMPAFMARKLAAEGEGTARVLGRGPAQDKAGRMAQDRGATPAHRRGRGRRP